MAETGEQQIDLFESRIVEIGWILLRLREMWHVLAMRIMISRYAFATKKETGISRTQKQTIAEMNPED